MISNIGFKGTYLIKPPGSDDKSRRKNMYLLANYLKSTRSTGISPENIEILCITDKKEVYLDTEKTNSTSKTDFSDKDKNFLRPAILFFADSIEGTSNYRKALENHLENELENRDQKEFIIAPGVGKVHSTINLNLPENKPLTGLQRITNVVNFK